MRFNHLKQFFCSFLIFCSICAAAQVQQAYKPISTGASFLLVSPDARTTGVAEAATGLISDANASFINGAKLSFAKNTGVSFSYAPWLKELNNEIHLSYLSAYHKVSERSTIGFSLRYLDLGNINFRDDEGMLLAEQRANELALDGTFSKKFGDRLAMAVTARYIRSNLGNGSFNGAYMNAANSFAADVSIYSETQGNQSRLAWGLNLSNIGTKVKYDENNNVEAFLPMNLRAGLGYTLFSADMNSLTLLLDLNKLLVPTPPQYQTDANGVMTNEILKGKDPNRSVSSALFTSFYDAPGGFKEEIAEISIAGGLEFDYKNQVFFRTGYFYENPDKGNRQYLSAGLGLKIKPLQFDVAYMAPVNRTYAFRNGLKLTLSFQVN